MASTKKRGLSAPLTDFRTEVLLAAKEGASTEVLDIIYRDFAETHATTLALALGATRHCQLWAALRACDAGKYPDTPRAPASRWTPLRAAFAGAVVAAAAAARKGGLPVIVPDASVTAVDAVVAQCAADLAAGKLAWPAVADPVECPAVAAMVRGRKDVVSWLEASGYEWAANRAAISKYSREYRDGMPSLDARIVKAGDRALWAHFLSMVPVNNGWWYEYGCALRVAAVNCRSAWATAMMLNILPLHKACTDQTPSMVLHDAMVEAVASHNVDMAAVLLEQPCFRRALIKGVPAYQGVLRCVYREWYLRRIRSSWRREEWAELAEALEAQGFADAAAKMRDTDAKGVVR